MNYFKMPFTLIKYLGLSLLLCNCFSYLSAQSPVTEKKWNVLTEIYLLFPYMDGETGVGNRIALPVDASAGDIFSKLKFGGMLYVEAHNNKWAITSDILYMNLNQEVTGKHTITFRNSCSKRICMGTCRILQDCLIPGSWCRGPA